MSSSKLAGILGISPRYLLQIGAKLQKAGLVEVALGAAGGYSLGKDFYKLTLYDVFMAMEGTVQWPCSPEKTKEAFPKLKAVYKQLNTCLIQIMESIPLQDLLS